MKKIYLLLFLSMFFIVPSFAHASSVCEQDTTLDFVARDPDGSYISKATIEVYKQETDANNLPKPTTRFASGSADNSLGKAHLSWRNSAMASDTYAIKIKNINNDAASFWYYGVTFTCGQKASLDKTLSGIFFVLHDAKGEPLANANFNVYSQVYSANGAPLETKKTLLVTLNSGSSGKVKVYLPQGSVRSIDKAYSDHYVLELNRGNSKFIFYNIQVADGQLTTLDYYISSLQVSLKDVTGAAYPANTVVEVFKQTVSENNTHQKGDKVGEMKLDSAGYGVLELVSGMYVLGIKAANSQYQYFWDMQVEEGRSTTYSVTTVNDQTTTTNSSGVCPNNSQFTLILRNINGEIANGLKYELYEQKTNANGLPAAGAKINGGTIDSSGRSVINFKPDPRQTYALKIYDKKSDIGEYWFYDAVRFACDANRVVTKSIPSLKIILRDKAGALKRNFNFSLYAQKFDVDNKPIFETSDLVANLKTDGLGSATVYVAPYNAYRAGQTGFYAISAKDNSGNAVNVYNINITGEKDYNFSYTFSGVSGSLMDAARKPQANKTISLYEIIGSGSNKVLGRQLLKSKTDAAGQFSFDYPAGTYALVNLDQFNQNNIFWNIAVNSKSSGLSLVTNLTRLKLEDQQAEDIPGNASLKVYSLLADGSNYYRDKLVSSVSLDASKGANISLAEGPYLVLYSGKNSREYGVAYWASNNKLNSFTVYVNAKYLVSNKQYFKLTGVSSSSTSSSSSSSSSSSGSTASTPAPSSSSSSSSSLAGRILLQVEDKGQAWYISPTNNKRYYLGRPDDAFSIMRKLGLGISNKNFDALTTTPNRSLLGRILIKVEDNGRAYYYNPINSKLYYLGRPDDAFKIIRNLGLGISNTNLNKISVSN
jgi:hypothetical protein